MQIVLYDINFININGSIHVDAYAPLGACKGQQNDMK